MRRTKLFKGIWADNCQTPETMVVLSKAGVFNLLTNGNESAVNASAFAKIGTADNDNLAFKTTRQYPQDAPVTLRIVDGQLVMKSDRRLDRCTARPSELTPVHQFWVDGAFILPAILDACEKGAESCIREIQSQLRYRATRNLNKAEIAQGVRTLAITVDVLENDGPVAEEDLRETWADIQGPAATIAEVTMANYDLKDDGSLYIEELKGHPVVGWLQGIHHDYPNLPDVNDIEDLAETMAEPRRPVAAQ